MNDSIIEQVAEQINDGVYRSGTSARSSSYPLAKRIAETLAKAGLLRPEIDGAMIERASKVLWEHPDFPGTWQELSSSARMTYRILARTILEAALGGEQ